MMPNQYVDGARSILNNIEEDMITMLSAIPTYIEVHDIERSKNMGKKVRMQVEKVLGEIKSYVSVLSIGHIVSGSPE